MMQLVAGSSRFHLVRLGHEYNHLWDTCIPFSYFEEDVGQCRRRNNLQADEVAVKVERPLLISRPEDDFGDTNDIFHKHVPSSMISKSTMKRAQGDSNLRLSGFMLSRILKRSIAHCCCR